MSSTPEGRVKDLVRKALKAASAYWLSPVQNGLGKPGVDFHCCVPIVVTSEMVGMTIGVHVGIETKRPGGKPTPRQELTMKEMRAAGGITFVVDGDLQELNTWIADPIYRRASLLVTQTS